MRLSATAILLLGVIRGVLGTYTATDKFLDSILNHKDSYEAKTHQSEEDRSHLPAKFPIPMVMKKLLKAVQIVVFNENSSENQELLSMARSIRPTNIKENLQLVDLEFPPLFNGELRPGTEAWLVFQSLQYVSLGYNCTQVLNVYENDKTSFVSAASVTLDCESSDFFLVINITESLHRRPLTPNYSVVIKDSTPFSKQVQASEVLELHNPLTSPVLVLLSPHLAAKKLMGSMRVRGHMGLRGHRMRRDSQHLDLGKTRARRELQHKYCKLIHWELDTEKVGWDWIIYPQRLPLNLCKGECPLILDSYFNATTHSTIRIHYRLIMGQNDEIANMPACCVPTKYRTISVLIEKKEGVVELENFHDLSAIQCGCH